MVRFYLCDAAAIVTRNYPRVEITFLESDPSNEQIKEFLELIISALSDRKKAFHFEVDEESYNGLNQAARLSIDEGLEDITKTYCPQ